MDERLNEQISTAVADAMQRLQDRDWFQACPPDVQETILYAIHTEYTPQDAPRLAEALITLAGILTFVELAGANGG